MIQIHFLSEIKIGDTMIVKQVFADGLEDTVGKRLYVVDRYNEDDGDGDGIEYIEVEDNDEKRYTFADDEMKCVIFRDDIKYNRK